MKHILTSALLISSFLWMTCREIDDIQPNQPPQANAGEDRSVNTGEKSELDASGSTDTDDDMLSYTWQWVSKPQGSQAVILDFDSVKAGFTPDVAGPYVLRLLVSDNVESDADTLTITASAANGAPVANAGQDANVDLGTQFSLNGSGSDPDGDPLTYQWSLISKPDGSAAAVQNPGNQNALIVIDVHGTYVARLSVSDDSHTSVDDITITTNAVSITGINPSSGIHGITIKITGKNFSPVAGQNSVTINGAAATVTGASLTNLDATVPKGAGTGVVVAIVNGVTATGPVFTYILSPTVSTVVQFQSPGYTIADANGNVYISDITNHTIRRLTPGGQLTTIAGTGTAGYGDAKDPLQAQFNMPSGLAIHNSNLYVADNGNHCIRRISLGDGAVYTLAGFPQPGFADGPGPQAQFNGPIGLAVDSQGNLYVGDANNSRIRRISTTVNVSTIAGNGQNGFADGNGVAAQFNGLAGLAMSPTDILYVADVLNHRIRRIDGQGTVTTLAGNGTGAFVNGTGTAARFNNPYGVSCDPLGNIYVADLTNHSIRRVTPRGVVTTVAGNGTAGLAEGTGMAARFNQPTDITVVPNGDLYIADYGNQRVRRITFE